MSYLKISAFASVMIVCVVIVDVYAQSSVIVTGMSYRLNDKGAYEPLPRVEVVAYRHGQGPILPTPAITNGQGRFLLQLPPGDAFTVVFYGENFVPELQQLAAIDRTSNEVNVALLTLKQYDQQHKGGQTAADRIKCIELDLPRDTKDPLSGLRRMIEKLKSQTRTTSGHD